MNYTAKYLSKLVDKQSFCLGSYLVISQEPQVIGEADKAATCSTYLPMFICLWHDIEQVTGHRWKCTSFIRNSPSHQRGHAFDLAPDLDPKDASGYAVTRRSDPVLYKRAPLIRALNQLVQISYGPVPLGIFIEPDHLHVQVLNPNSGERYPTSVVAWPIPKPIYPDTLLRMKLPMLSETGGPNQ